MYIIGTKLFFLNELAMFKIDLWSTVQRLLLYPDQNIAGECQSRFKIDFPLPQSATGPLNAYTEAIVTDVLWGGEIVNCGFTSVSSCDLVGTLEMRTRVGV